MLQLNANRTERAVLALVDDDAPLRAALAFDLDIAGFQVSAFGDAESALAAAAEETWSCLIVDLKLPGMSGLDFAEELRRQGVVAPVILITTTPSRSTRARARAADLEIVEKPLLAGDLVRSIRRLLITN
ncbi:MAG: response regulator [Hyphomonadaceae bacterium]|nr:response regulator [Hyphomonadaceae bacterium]